MLDDAVIVAKVKGQAETGCVCRRARGGIIKEAMGHESKRPLCNSRKIWMDQCIGIEPLPHKNTILKSSDLHPEFHDHLSESSPNLYNSINQSNPGFYYIMCFIIFSIS